MKHKQTKAELIEQINLIRTVVKQDLIREEVNRQVKRVAKEIVLELKPIIRKLIKEQIENIIVIPQSANTSIRSSIQESSQPSFNAKPQRKIPMVDDSNPLANFINSTQLTEDDFIGDDMYKSNQLLSDSHLDTDLGDTDLMESAMGSVRSKSPQLWNAPQMDAEGHKINYSGADPDKMNKVLENLNKNYKGKGGVLEIDPE